MALGASFVKLCGEPTINVCMHTDEDISICKKAKTGKETEKRLPGGGRCARWRRSRQGLARAAADR